MFPGSSLDPEMIELNRSLTEALIGTLPEGWTSGKCVIEQASNQPSGRLRYQIWSDDHPEEDFTTPSILLHESAYALYQRWTTDGEPFPGAELEVTMQSDGQWQCKLTRLDFPEGETPPTPESDETLWQAVYSAREAWFAEHLGATPDEIQKILSLMVAWPGGGLYSFAATKLGLGACATVGLSNADLPSRVRNEAIEESRTQQGLPASTKFRTVSRVPRWVPEDWPGYGYEVLVLTPQVETWPLSTLAWLAQMEILRDVDLLGRVNEFQGLTIESVHIGQEGERADFLIQPAVTLMPDKASLPNGEMSVLIATRITREEMRFALDNGRPELLRRLLNAGVGQVSDLQRASVV